MWLLLVALRSKHQASHCQLPRMHHRQRSANHKGDTRSHTCDIMREALCSDPTRTDPHSRASHAKSMPSWRTEHHAKKRSVHQALRAYDVVTTSPPRRHELGANQGPRVNQAMHTFARCPFPRQDMFSNTGPGAQTQGGTWGATARPAPNTCVNARLASSAPDGVKRNVGQHSQVALGLHAAVPRCIVDVRRLAASSVVARASSATGTCNRQPLRAHM